jgi:hypothetical protein
MPAGTMVNCTNLDTVRIEILGEGKARSFAAKDILLAFEPKEPGDFVELARGVLQYADILSNLQALSGDPERGLRKMRGHLASLVVDARLALGMEAFPQ